MFIFTGSSSHQFLYELLELWSLQKACGHQIKPPSLWDQVKRHGELSSLGTCSSLTHLFLCLQMKFLDAYIAPTSYSPPSVSNALKITYSCNAHTIHDYARKVLCTGVMYDKYRGVLRQHVHNEENETCGLYKD